MRKYDYIRPSKTVSLERYWLFFDTEGNIIRESETRQRQTFRLGYAKYFELDNNLQPTRVKEIRLYRPEDIGDFILSVLEPKATLHIVAHNCAYDLQVTDLLRYLVGHGFTLTFLYLKEPTVIIKMHRGKLRLSIEDGYNRLRGTIEDWGKRLNLPKGKVDFEHVSDDDLFEYCKRDVEILAQATLYYIRFVREHELGSLKYTISSQAFTAYRYRFMPTKIGLHHDPKVTALEREAYGGGMVRLFHKGIFDDDKYYLLDVNSMYAYVMKNFDYPYKLLTYRTGVDVDYIKRFIERYAIIARCKVKPARPAFRCRHLGKITYPLAEFTGVFTTEELKLLLEDNAIREVYEVAVYKKGRLFDDYVDYFWRIREDAIRKKDAVLKEMAKQFLNSLYGKFGMKTYNWVICDALVGATARPDMYFDLKKGIRSPVLWLGDTPYICVQGDEADNSMVAIAAHVTANARLTLWHYVEKVGYKNMYYTDTDSLIVPGKVLNMLWDSIDPNTLGKLKIEAEGDSLVLFARKDYILGDRIVCKGVGKAYLQKGATEYKREQWRSLRRYLKEQGLPEVLIEVKTLELKRQCYDGKLDATGEVLPYKRLPTRWD